MLSFEDCEEQFTSEKLTAAFSEYDLFRLIRAAWPAALRVPTGRRLARLATPHNQFNPPQEGAVMRLSASRIRSISLRIAQAEGSAFAGFGRNARVLPNLSNQVPLPDRRSHPAGRLCESHPA